ncbi:MAG: hypothetical protein LBT05_04835 [Planctomycetaceae bacterium]|jgi:hypothetical protein|nr:hypothetical protein [Planctomycetaceae bacterium]
MPTLIDPKRILADLETQSRATLNDEVVKEYAEAMEEGATFPAILVFYDEPNDQFILAEGFHRLAAHMRVKPNDMILAEQRLGDVEDARWASIAANQSHGLRRTNADKRNAIKLAFLHPKGCELSDRQVSKHIGVDHKTVSAVRLECEATGEIPQSNLRTGQDGRTINTTNIGSGQKPKACMYCFYYENDRCTNDGSEPLPWNLACEDFKMKIPDPPQQEIPPPDYDNIKISDFKKKPEKTNPNQYRRLKNCTTVHLPSDNPTLFAVELRNRWSPEYLTACIAALKHILMDNE